MSISNFTPNSIHHSKTKIKTERLWKNYHQKKYICKPSSGLKMNCKLIAGLIN